MMSVRLGELLMARGLDLETLGRFGFDGMKRGGGDECLVIPFRRDGQVVRRKYRYFDRGDDKPKWEADKGAQRLAWNEDCLRDEALRSQSLIVTEGEIDALTAIQCGFPRTISVPDGAPPPGERSKSDLEAGAKYEWLSDIRPFLSADLAPEIIIAADGDENGAAMLHDLSVLLGRYRCKYLVYPRAKNPEARGRSRLKDLNEVLQDYGQKGVVETITRAEWVRVDGVFRMGQLPPLPAPTVYEIGFYHLSRNYRMRLGDFVVVTGTPGFGKTTLVHDLCCRVVDHYGVTCAWASFEQSPQRDHRRNLRAWKQGCAYEDGPTEAEADEWIDARHVFIVPSEDDDVTLDWILDRMEVAVVRHQAKLIVIDPWNEMDHTREPNETQTEYVGRAIKRLKRFARKMQVHLILVAHPTKNAKDASGNYRMPTLYDISDSAHFYNKCDLGLIVHRETEDDTIVKVQKSRYHEAIGVPGEVRMQLRKDDRHFVEIERIA